MSITKYISCLFYPDGVCHSRMYTTTIIIIISLQLDEYVYEYKKLIRFLQPSQPVVEIIYCVIMFVFYWQNIFFYSDYNFLSLTLLYPH